MYDITIKRGDTRNAIKAMLKGANGVSVDLTGCNVQFVMAPLNRPTTISRAAHIENAETGEVWVVWVLGDTDFSGIYQAEFKVTFPDGRKETFPNTSYISIKIIDDLRGGE